MIDNNYNVQCKAQLNGMTCNRVLRYHRNTTSMLSHLKSVHKNLFPDEPSTTDMSMNNFNNSLRTNINNNSNPVIDSRNFLRRK